MLKSIKIIIIALVSITLISCSTGISALQSYIDSRDGYQFLYPKGWIEVTVKNASEGVDVVFRDLIEQTENLSVIISQVPDNKTLADLGTPTEVGYRLLQEMNQNPDSNRKADLINAEVSEIADKTYYILEYQVQLPNNQQRHNIASVSVSRNKLFTFNLSTIESRWNKLKTLFKTVVHSFSVY
ncbi:photosystem II oxygen evolving complex protein PsbP [Rippkaea orientalis PCC 8801]|uniref:Photosystem II oxygen evolving complex protein PsbP n=1 Tax=Rippkaea orientalis (strain PCC 8801 / RF-1) TaxID=41431 RepID=B7K3Z9_RIPO1|nr:photosystem II reaction center PsbP [Rippkaea orientalis]ACK66539.1 photosystem II oxygen evolving complex protein PsbP [Rippkaea orientalis PCC 8801]